MSACDHINIAKFVEAFRDEHGNLFIIMGLYDDNFYHKRDEELEEDKYYDEELIVDILRQICEGLRYLHRKNIAHRDIDPRNIMIKDGVVKLVDFGFSNHYNSKS